MSRESAINFLSSVVEDYGKAVLHPSQETEEFLVEEIKKVIKTNVKVYQRNHSIEDKKMFTLTVLLCFGQFMGVLIKLFLEVTVFSQRCLADKWGCMSSLIPKPLHHFKTYRAYYHEGIKFSTCSYLL